MAVMSLVCMAPGCGQRAQDAGSVPPLKGAALLEKYGNCPAVKPEDNKIGLVIDSLSHVDGNSFRLQWSSEIIKKNNLNSLIVVVFMFIVDANDFNNYKHALLSRFHGSMGSHENMTVTLDKPAESILIYYKGIGASIPNSESYRTPPLFFMADLGDTPRVLEQTPRLAGELFKEIDKKEEEKKEEEKKNK